MTYKEAKETIKSNYPPSHYSMLREALDMAMEEFEKADKYRWHDLRKDPKDLPTQNGWYRVYMSVAKNGSHVKDMYFIDNHWDDFDISLVIGWKIEEPFEVME